MKRSARIADPKVWVQAWRVSKASWTDLYFDLYRQTHGEGASEQEIMQDARRRLKALSYVPSAGRTGARGSGA